MFSNIAVFRVLKKISMDNLRVLEKEILNKIFDSFFFLSDFLSTMPVKYNNKTIIWCFKLHPASCFITSILCVRLSTSPRNSLCCEWLEVLLTLTAMPPPGGTNHQWEERRISGVLSCEKDLPPSDNAKVFTITGNSLPHPSSKSTGQA